MVTKAALIEDVYATLGRKPRGLMRPRWAGRMLRARYFPDFKGGPKLLFWGNADGMRYLVAVLESFPPTGSEHVMSGLMNNAPKLVLRSAAESRGMQKQDHLFEWILEPKTVADFRDKVQVLTTANLPGHQYLECNTADEITVMVSCDEYPSALKP